MAAEGYARIARKPGLVIATAGPGAINTLNGVFGAYTDSIPMVVLTGQARKNTQKSNFELKNLRQLGDQEAPLLEMVKPITKSQYEVTQEMSANQIIALIDKAYGDTILGRPGPVWIEIPVDVQGLKLEVEEELIESIAAYSENSFPEIPSEFLDLTLEKIQQSHRPVLLIGTGVFWFAFLINTTNVNNVPTFAIYTTCPVGYFPRLNYVIIVVRYKVFNFAV